MGVIVRAGSTPEQLFDTTGLLICVGLVMLWRGAQWWLRKLHGPASERGAVRREHGAFASEGHL